MKAYLVSALLLTLTVAGVAQEARQALYYSLPKTKLCVEIELEKTTRKPGQFYRYSERYLATTNVITSEKTDYKLKSVTVTPVAVPDSARTFSVDTEKSPLNICVNSDGILCGVNVDLPPVSKSVTIRKTINEDGVRNGLLPLTEEFMMAGSEAKMAEGAAKQIYHIRESRLSLLTADVEKMPADGASLKTMLEGLDRSERRLSELFIGSVVTETETRKIYVTPAGPINNQVLFRLSALLGLVSADDLSGAPYYITLSAGSDVAAAVKEKQSPAAFYYLQPAQASVVITDGINVINKTDVFIAQMGKLLALPQSLFKKDELKVQIDPQTGRLLRISK